MFGLVVLDIPESLRLMASEGFDSNCWGADGAIEESRQLGLRVMKEKRGTSEWKSFYRPNPWKQEAMQIGRASCRERVSPYV